MSRPSKRRYVSPAPKVEEFRPVGVPAQELRRLSLPLDGLEALRLVDLMGLEQAEAARQMGVSRQTFGRILAAARRLVSQAVVGGLALRIETTGNLEIRTAAPAVTERAASGRVAVSAHAASLDAAVAPRFGRAPGFMLVDPLSMAFEYVANDVAADQQHGTGLAAAELVCRAGATVVLTGFVGAKAARALSAAGLRVADGLGALTVREAVERFARGEIAPAPSDEVAAGGSPAERTSHA